MMAAGTRKLTTEGRNKEKKWVNGTMPFCQTNRVVISPKGLKEPPALVATTMLTQAIETNLGFFLPMTITTEPIRRAVDKLEITADSRKDRIPVIQNNLR